jgi:hypothetical protein
MATNEPAVTRSAHIALADLKLDELCIVHAGSGTYPLAPRVRAVALESIQSELRPL